ncbi:hypothetical protein J8273_4813 [Carpediemonas membranifera]|uniref:Uncharacterized protein n=1 Tax=Carpediemonas membranifera TaxID=201153 RepID=A0A8J6B3S8_9EUKA|nr:hypothetical protein J8273_4813 [Carpediemonas membranifera]|eukprot:KAG9393694.1 hypothetical protein J8273_4813 [Carpediemonas membranifera]
MRERAPEHAFRHNKNSKKTKLIYSFPNEGVCPRCHAIIQWRKDYRQYKPLTTPKKCTSCDQKKIVAAYHIICSDCAKEANCCEKCKLPRDQWPKEAVDVSTITKDDL